MAQVFEIIGIICTVFILGCLWVLLIEWFAKWRSNKCKIKFLCKHVYAYDWVRSDLVVHSKMALKCKKCGKIAKFDVDVKSFMDVSRF